MRDDPMEILQKITEENASYKNIQIHLIELSECLYKDLQEKTSVVESLQKQLHSLLKQECFGITSKYVSLKEKYEIINTEIINLKNENDDLHTQLIAKNEETKKLLLEKEKEMQLHYMSQIKEKDELIKHKEKELQTVTLNHQKTEQELYNEIQAVEASSALQLDQMESNFRRQLNEVNKKLKESVDTCNTLRNDLFNSKEQLNECKSRIAELQRQLRENQSFEHAFRQQERSLNNGTVNESPVSEKSHAGLYSKYQPLEINQKNISSVGDKSFTYKKTPVYRGSARFSEESCSSTSKYNSLPPLMKLSNGSKGKIVKKRKLYNPDDPVCLDIGDGDSECLANTKGIENK